MLWERYTGRARKAMLHAEDWAIRLKSPFISTEHILLGLLEEEDTLAVQMMQMLGADIQQMKAELENQLKAIAPPRAPIGSPTLTSSAKQLLIRAAEEVRSLGDSHVDTAHLLLGLLREKQGLAAKILAKYNVRYEDVKRRLYELKQEMQRKPLEKVEFAEFAEDWTRKASEGEFCPVSFWQKERERFTIALLRKEVPNILLLGNLETAFLLVQQFACELLNNPLLLQRRFLRLTWSKLMSDMEVMRLLDKLGRAKEPKPVLLVGTVEDIFHWSDAMLVIAQGKNLPVIAIATPSQWEEFQRRFPFAATTFIVIAVDEPNEEETLEWLKAHKSVYERFHEVVVDDEALTAILSLAKDKFADLPLLATTRNLLDEVCAYAKTKASSTVNPEVVREYASLL